MQNGKKCVAFESTQTTDVTVSPVIQPRIDIVGIPIATPETKACERVATSKLCIPIDSFTKFKEQVENATGTIIFCPFTLNKPPLETVYISTNVNIICNVARECRINGSISQIKVVGGSAQVFFQGFVFGGATGTAVHIASSARRTQSFCDCHFVE